MDDLKLQKELEAYLVRLCKQEESLVCRFEEERAIIQKQAQAIRDTISILSGGHPFNESKKIKVNSSHHRVLAQFGFEWLKLNFNRQKGF